MTESRLITPVLVGGCLIVLVSFGIRSTFGLFQIPIASEFGWPRAEFSLAIAIQNIAWGIAAPLFGALAERWGDRLAIVAGTVFYVAGLLLSTLASTAAGLQLLEFLVGAGIAGTGLGIVLAVVGRASSARNRSLSLAIVTAVASAGQFIGPPVTSALLGALDWREVFMVFSAALVAALLLLPLLRAPARAVQEELAESMGAILLRAFRDPSYSFLFLGFFSCGFQLGFITAHFPAFVTEVCAPLDPSGILAGFGIGSTAVLGAVAISVIGICNILGTLVAGWLGQSFPKKYLLSLIYVGRTLLSVLFIALPMTPVSVLVFSAGMGMLWLATVPLTAGLVAHLYGLRYMGTLYGIIFLSHQIGSFIGIWLGGALYDRFGTYDVVWWVGIGVGAFSALIHLPVREPRVLAPA